LKQKHSNNICSQIKLIKIKIEKSLEQFYSNKISKLIDKSPNLKDLYNHIKKKIGPQNATVMFDDKNNPLNTNKEIAEAFANHFKSVFKAKTHYNKKNAIIEINQLSNPMITMTDIVREII